MPPAVNNHGEVLGLLRSDPALDAPDLQVLFIDVPLSVPSLPGPDQGYALLVSLMSPHSRGSVQPAAPSRRLDPALTRTTSRVAPTSTSWSQGWIWRGDGRERPDQWRARSTRTRDYAQRDSLRAYLRRAVQTYHHPVTCRTGETTRPCSTPSRVHGTTDHRRPRLRMPPLSQATRG
jgi:choline dehydrogenase